MGFEPGDCGPCDQQRVSVHNHAHGLTRVARDSVLERDDHLANLLCHAPLETFRPHPVQLAAKNHAWACTSPQFTLGFRFSTVARFPAAKN
jgi:hypothetical protein